MKKIIQPLIRERAQYYCDKHPDRECHAEVKTMCWYGSTFDLLNLEMHLCDECMKEFYDLVKERFGVEPKECDII
jgi:hypothetical protein